MYLNHGPVDVLRSVARCDGRVTGEKIDQADVLLVAVKTYHTVDAIRPLKHVQAKSVFSVQNGVLKNQQLIDVFGEDAVLGSIGILSGELLDGGLVRFTLNQIVEVGELPAGTSERSESIAASLNGAGINALATDSIQVSEWSKFVGWSGYASLSVLTRLETFKFLSDADSARVTARVMRETASVAAALGVPILQAAECGHLFRQAAKMETQGSKVMMRTDTNDKTIEKEDSDAPNIRSPVSDWGPTDSRLISASRENSRWHFFRML